MPSPWPRPSARPRLVLIARGLWWRRGSALTLLAVATVTIAASALGPLYARAASESTLRDRLTEAAVTDSGFSLQDTVDASQPDVADDPQAEPPEPGQLFGYPTRIAALDAQVSVRPVGGSGRQLSTVLWRDGFCDHVVVVKGRCPTRRERGDGEQPDPRRRLRLAPGRHPAHRGSERRRARRPRGQHPAAAHPDRRRAVPAQGLRRPVLVRAPVLRRAARPGRQAGLRRRRPRRRVHVRDPEPSVPGAAGPGLPARRRGHPARRRAAAARRHEHGPAPVRRRGHRPAADRAACPAGRRRPRARPAAGVDHAGRRTAGAAGVARAVPGRHRLGRVARQRGRAGEAARLQRPVDGGVRPRPAGGGAGRGDPRRPAGGLGCRGGR